MRGEIRQGKLACDSTNLCGKCSENIVFSKRIPLKLSPLVLFQYFTVTSLLELSQITFDIG